MQDNVKVITDFFKDRFLVVSSSNTKALANMQMQELAQKKDKSIKEYYCRFQSLMSKLGIID